MARIVLSFIPLILLFLLAFILGKNNAQDVSVNLLVVEQTYSLGAVIGVTLAVGFILGLLTIAGAYLRLKWTVRRLRKALVKQVASECSQTGTSVEGKH
ncbi:LapA family protein [Aliidiomarina sanyensis]|uniref:Lipopolysaccharide assembly protein A domain-containing protein n=1 Tax=Aliidiomarina sanyensis TaxID=1249555 RepID=A0A432WS09_9GAMM|nr:LapA family protein [Aliidiomarina sanyensis]RUO36561.1 hypothetical protein CWE11_01740 [Aliidiomarina sanyensis]